VASCVPFALATQTLGSPRPAAFRVPGAPAEPLDEIALPVRARRLDAWLGPGRDPTAANQRAWLYQHAWIVTGASFGWWHGAEALRLLIRVDRRVESRWGIGYRSEAAARRALAAVEARAKEAAGARALRDERGDTLTLTDKALHMTTIRPQPPNLIASRTAAGDSA
jgi:hypothetical protein